MTGAAVPNIAGYAFAHIAACDVFRGGVEQRATELGLLGKFIVAAEGISFYLSGNNAQLFGTWLKEDHRFAQIDLKMSYSDGVPLRRLKVVIRPEIIRMGEASIDVVHTAHTAVRRIDAQTLKRWLEAGTDDDGLEVVTLDTRNDYETAYGTFEGAIDFGLRKFTDFPGVIAANRSRFDGKRVVSFCTGGIRCEKAALYMEKVGIQNVAQLNGGILKYFEDIGGEHYQGSCFVFDQRVAVDSSLKPIPAEQHLPQPSSKDRPK